ncbi:hypothetical protein ACQSAV_29535, partial [Klebsiella pneumoniae]
RVEEEERLFGDWDALVSNPIAASRLWSLLRALLARPEALLLDEPFSRLDASLRAGFRRWVFEELARQAIPAILVTHDREDCPPSGRCLAMERWQ